MKEPGQLLVALVQTSLEWEFPEANRSHFEGLLNSISSEVDLVCLPEMFSTGFSMNVEGCAEPVDGPTVTWLNKMSLERSFGVCCSVMTKESGRYYNRFYLSENGAITCIYDKRHLFRMADEHLAYTPGKDPAIFDFRGWKVMPRVCYDLRFPVWSRSSVAQVQIYVANWPEARIAAWDKLLMARAIENQCYVIGVNRTGTDGSGKIYPGHSMVINPWGEPIAEYVNGKDEIIVVTIDLNVVNGFREKFPVHIDADHFELKF